MDLVATPGYVAGFPDTMNLRELGGLPADGGRVVRHGLLYRAGSLVGLSDEQRALVDSFGLRYILDLRAAGEAAGADDYVPAGCAYERIGGMVNPDGTEVDFSPASIQEMQNTINALDDPDSFMRDLYLSMAFGNRAVHALVSRLAGGQAPLLFHCTAGKDRTGVCAALVLMTLGVPDDVILADFLLTNEYRREIIEHVPDESVLRAAGVDADAWAKANGVSADNLEAVFVAIDARHPTREAYLEEEFGLSKADIARIRDCLLVA